MITLSISQEDAIQVQAILRTHAEMQDQRILEIGPIRMRLKLEEADNPDAIALVNELEEQIEYFEEDAENLKRIADIFR